LAAQASLVGPPARLELLELARLRGRAGAQVVDLADHADRLVLDLAERGFEVIDLGLEAAQLLRVPDRARVELGLELLDLAAAVLDVPLELPLPRLERVQTAARLLELLAGRLDLLGRTERGPDRLDAPARLVDLGVERLQLDQRVELSHGGRILHARL